MDEKILIEALEKMGYVVKSKAEAEREEQSFVIRKLAELDIRVTDLEAVCTEPEKPEPVVPSPAEKKDPKANKAERYSGYRKSLKKDAAKNWKDSDLARRLEKRLREMGQSTVLLADVMGMKSNTTVNKSLRGRFTNVSKSSEGVAQILGLSEGWARRLVVSHNAAPEKKVDK